MYGRRIIRVLCATALAGCAVDVPGVAVTTVDTLPGGIPHVRNATAAQDTTVLPWRFEEELVIAPPDSSPEALVGPSAVVRLMSGAYVVADASPRILKLFDPSGRFVRTIGREGGGPGEYRFIQLGAHVDTILVFDTSQRRLTWFAPDGTLLRLASVPSSWYGPTLDVTREGTASIASGAVWLRVSPQGIVVDSVAVPPDWSGRDSWEFEMHDTQDGRPRIARERIPFVPSRQHVFLPSGELLHGTTDRLEIVRSRTGLDTLRLISSEAPRVAIADSARERAFQQARSGNGVVRFAEPMSRIVRKDDIPTHRPPWTGLRADTRGRLWVTFPSLERAHTRWEAFDSTGAWLGRVATPHHRFAGGRWSGDRFILIDEDAAGRPVVRVYRLIESR